jgi:hypothetical protein
MLETRCLENKIPARHVREMGGIKVIKALALEKMKMNTDSESNSDESNLDSGTHTGSPEQDEEITEVCSEEEIEEEIEE